MTWTTPTTRVPRELIDYLDWNTDIVDNLVFLKGYIDKLPLLSDATETSVSNSTAETTLFTGIIPANTLSTTKILIARMWFREINNTGGTTQTTFRVKYGGTTMLSILTGHTSTATAYIGYLEAWIRADGATNAQEADGCVLFQQAGAGTTPNWGSNEGTAAVNSAANQTLLITSEFNTLSVNMSLISKGTLILGAF